MRTTTYPEGRLSRCSLIGLQNYVCAFFLLSKKRALPRIYPNFFSGGDSPEFKMLCRRWLSGQDLSLQTCPFPKENDYLPEETLCRSCLTGFQSGLCGHLLCSKNSTFHCTFRTLGPFGPSHGNRNSHYSPTFSFIFGNWCVRLSTVFQPVSTWCILDSHYSPMFSIIFANWCLQCTVNECSVWSTDVGVVTCEFWSPIGPKISKVSLS